MLAAAVALHFAGAAVYAQQSSTSEYPQVAAASSLLNARAPQPARAGQFSLDVYLGNTTPVSLRTGMPLGGGLSLRRSLGSGPLVLGARVGATESAEATRDWQLTHVGALAGATLGLEWRRGRGLFRSELVLGAMLVEQLGDRQQLERRKAAGLPDLRRDGWSLGPFVSAEVSAAVELFKSWSAFVQLGPGFTVQRVSGRTIDRFLVSSGLGVGHAF
jgi:hypothetical protein